MDTHPMVMMTMDMNVFTTIPCKVEREFLIRNSSSQQQRHC